MSVCQNKFSASSIAFSTITRMRTELDIDKLTDDMSSREHGSSFIDHQENSLES
ncbi:hypothetical protein E4U61_006817, partial [Claviceps capensis]